MRLTPSPCLVVNHNDNVRSTIMAMQKARRSYVLVNNDLGECVGIFTDRDILTGFFDLHGEALARPVTSVMTSPVIMLPLSHRHQAPQLMRERNIRHVPIYDLVDDRRHVLGVITLYSLAAENLLKPGPQLRADQPDHGVESLAVVSADGSTFNFVRHFFQGTNTAVDRLFHTQLTRHPQFQEVVARYGVLVIDLDDLPESSWTWMISTLNRMEGLEDPLEVLVVLDPQRHGQGVLQVLNTIARAGWLTVFTKPVDLVAFDQAMRCAQPQTALKESS
jgi:hypothetical protein